MSIRDFSHQTYLRKENPKEDIKRCPNGRGEVKQLLHRYTLALINLGGAIKKSDLADIFNQQTGDHVTPQEVYDLLLHLVHRDRYYCFYGDYIIHSWMFDDLNLADNVIYEHRDKPAYIPPQDELLNYEYASYCDETEQKHWMRFFRYLIDHDFYFPIGDYAILRDDAKIGYQDFAHEFIENILTFNEPDKVSESLMMHLQEAMNNTKMWMNRGHSPYELNRIEWRPQQKNEPRRIAMGNNELCFCGSGKKYKKCCRRLVESGTAHLSYADATFFFETMYGLYSFVNEELDIIPQIIVPTYPNKLSEQTLYPVSKAIWKQLELIDLYLEKAYLEPRRRALIESWRDYHRRDLFYLIEYREDDALFLGSDENKNDILFAVKGLKNSIGYATRCIPPTAFRAVLLPFEGVIVYEGYMEELLVELPQRMHDQAAKLSSNTPIKTRLD